MASHQDYRNEFLNVLWCRPESDKPTFTNQYPCFENDILEEPEHKDYHTDGDGIYKGFCRNKDSTNKNTRHYIPGFGVHFHCEF